MIPGVTGNAQLLLGHIIGAVIGRDNPVYSLVDADPGAGFQIFEHRLSGNRYRISVEQVEGVE